MYYQTEEKAKEVQDRFAKEFKIFENIYFVEGAKIWKWWLGTQKSWEKECAILERKKIKAEIKRNLKNK